MQRHICAMNWKEPTDMLGGGGVLLTGRDPRYLADFELTLIVIIMAAEMDHEARDCICSDQILIYYRITKKNNNNNIVTTCITKMPG